MHRVHGMLLAVAGLVAATTQAAAWEVPGCRTAWNALGERQALTHMATLIRNDCPVMYRKGWLVGPEKAAAGEVPGCRKAWDGLRAQKAAEQGQFLVTHNCPVIYRYGWRQN